MEQEKEEKRINRERNRTENDRNQQNGNSGRRKSPQNTMRINVDDFDEIKRKMRLINFYLYYRNSGRTPKILLQ
ncbi:unnamed protein product [Rotaria sordida]|uniref:Uncharacterized protein n=1 Tax=Rotaria sordida TaxID=392033 RepID=A0A819V6H2_9BILA|nr:unnamed protein product [Rotaria sordida]